MGELQEKEFEIVLDRYQQVRNKVPLFRQFDTDISKLTFKFLENGSSFDIPYTRQVLFITKPDGTEVYQEVTKTGANTSEVILKNQALTVSGELECQIKLYVETKMESMNTFSIEVGKSIGNDEPIKGENEYQILQQLIIDINTNITKNNKAVEDNIQRNNEELRTQVETMNQSVEDNIFTNNQALCEALSKIDASELVKLKEVVDLLTVNKLGKTEKAADSELLNGVRDEVESIADTLVKRNSDGNVKVGNAVEMSVNGQKQPLQLVDGAHLKVGSRNVWDDGNLVIEQGTWTPYFTGLNPIYESRAGNYYRIGNQVYFDCSITVTGWNGVQGALKISGLPFSAKDEVPFSVSMLKGTKESNYGDQREAFAITQGTALSLLFRGVNGAWWGSAYSIQDVHENFVVKISGSYIKK